MARKYAEGLSAAEYVGLLKADFGSLEKLDEIVNKTLYGLMITDYKSSQAAKYGASFESYKYEALQERGAFAGMVRMRLGRALGVVANKARQKVPANHSGLQDAVQSGTFKNSLGGTVRITDSKKRDSRKRVWAPGTKKHRTVLERTKQINEYYGRDRAFILRILNSGTDLRMATADVHGKGTGATWGARKSISPKWYFHTVKSDMDQAAEQLGIDIHEIAEQILESAYTEAGS